MKRFSRIALMTLAMVVADLAQPTVLRAQGANERANLTVAEIAGPQRLRIGLSGTYKVTIQNINLQTVPVELHIIFAGKADQTGRIVADGGLACEVGHDAGINAVVRCTGGEIEAGGTVTVVVQARGQAFGIGQLVVTVNASRSVLEESYEDNLKQFTVYVDT